MTGYEAPTETITIPNSWVYRGEGNCNVVIVLQRSKEILRIRKTERPKSILGWILVLISDFLYWYYGIGFKEEVRDLSFYSKIMRPLLGNNYTSEAKQVILTRKQIQVFKDELAKKRPEFRQDKTLQYGRAALFNDFAFLPLKFDHFEFSDNTFAVEIKPKQGWRPYKEQFFSQCFFCMHQYLKVEKKRIKLRTKYCPEELFSGDEERMQLALKHLIEVPQNNFKIFKNGLLCYDDKLKNLKALREIFEAEESDEILLAEFCKFIQKCLLTNLDPRDNQACKSICHNTCSLKKETRLPKGSVLERIMSLQMLDQEGTHSTYKKLSKNDTWDDFSFVDKILEIIDKQENTCIGCTILEAAKRYENELHFLPYLIAAIAKDCSLMITFRKLKERPSDDSVANNVFETTFGTFLVNIGVFDLYPKPLSTIHKHYKRNRDIFKALKKCELLT